MEMTPLTLFNSFPVPVVIPMPLADVTVPLLLIVTLPPPLANAFTPHCAAVTEEEVSSVRARLPVP